MMASSLASSASATLCSIATRSAVGIACSFLEAVRALCANSRELDVADMVFVFLLVAG